jgi:hypothetical protein
VLFACTVYEVCEKLYPLVAPWVNDLGGLLMPEHFWLAFDAGDINAMRDELAKAKSEAALRVVARYEGYSIADKRKVEKVYQKILAALQDLRVAT